MGDFAFYLRPIWLVDGDAAPVREIVELPFAEIMPSFREESPRMLEPLGGDVRDELFRSTSPHQAG